MGTLGDTCFFGFRVAFLRAIFCYVLRDVKYREKFRAIEATDFVLRIVSFSFNIVFKPATTEDFP